MVINFYFLLFFSLLIFCSFCVILSKNPVHSVFFLILVFLFVSLLFMIIGAEFLSILLLVIYVGAVSILFLFVVMMLNLRILEQYTTFYNYLPLGFFVGFFIFLIFSVVYSLNLNILKVENIFVNNDYNFWIFSIYYQSNIFYFGLILYNHYYVFVIIVSLILLIAMFGSIILTVDFEYRTLPSKEVFVDRFIWEILLYFVNLKKND